MQTNRPSVIAILVLILSLPLGIYAQSENADELLNEAIYLMDNGDPMGAISLLEEAKKMDPGRFIYDYEIGYAHYLNEDMKSSLETFKKVIKYPDANDQCYQMLGNLYDFNGKRSKAMKTYDKGLKKFPQSGRLHLEKGNIYFAQAKYYDALNLYELGILAEPNYPSNYFRAAQIYFNSTEEIWGMFYGEIFMNLERNSERTVEMSKMLFETYNSEITFKSDTSISVSFSQRSRININISSRNLKNNPESLLEAFTQLPYPTAVYEPTIIFSLTGEKEVNLASLHRTRKRFVERYFEKEYNIKYPNILIDYHKRLLDLGLFEPYNYWILMKGNEDEFEEWESNHEKLWKNFSEWFSQNPLFIGPNTRFNSSQY